MALALALFVATGAVAGLLAGLLGIGGGLVMVPALIYALPLIGADGPALTQTAVGTSLACISVIAINSAFAHHRRAGVAWGVVARMAPGLALGALAGAGLAHIVSSERLAQVIGIAALLVATRMLLARQPAPGRGLPGAAGLAATGAGIGGLSSLVGIGGGSLTVPFLLWCNRPMVVAVGTSAACGIPIAWAGMLGFMVMGAGTATASWSLGYVNLIAAGAIVLASLAATPLGARLAHRLPTRVLRRLFAGLLIAVGLDLLLG